MGLKANGRLTNLLPLRHRGAQGMETFESGRASRRNVYVGGIAGSSAVPNGAQPGSAILTAETSGGIAAYTTVSGNGTIGGQGALGLAIQAALTGLGTISGAGSKIIQAAADLAGAGTLTAEARATLALEASLAGLGTLTGVASSLQILAASAALTGQGSIDATWSALAGLIASLQGTGAIGAVPYAPGSLAANITSLDPLSPGALADRVWNGTAIEGSFTAAQLLKLVSAVLAGKTSIVDLGGGNATVTFRDVNDLRNRLVASMTGSQRTTVTKDVA
jgi:hypothetical protein